MDAAPASRSLSCAAGRRPRAGARPPPRPGLSGARRHRVQAALRRLSAPTAPSASVWAPSDWGVASLGTGGRSAEVWEEEDAEAETYLPVSSTLYQQGHRSARS